MGAVHSSLNSQAGILAEATPPDIRFLSDIQAPAAATDDDSLVRRARPAAVIAEKLVDAFGLNRGHFLQPEAAAYDVSNVGLVQEREAGIYVALDCEMVGVGKNGEQSALARVSLVDFHGQRLYDSYVRPRRAVTDWRTHVSGIEAHHMEHARQFDQVQRDVADIVSERVLVGHDLKHDLGALELDVPARDIRDTCKLAEFRRLYGGRKPSLRRLAKDVLGLTIQQGSHSSIMDARASMMLFCRYKTYFDAEHAERYAGDSTEKKKIASASSLKRNKKKKVNKKKRR